MAPSFTIAMAVVTLAARGVNAGFSLSALQFANGLFPASVADAKSLMENDAWVDTTITSPTPSLCKSLGECGWNRTSWNRSVLAYADIVSSKRMLLEDSLVEAEAPAVIQIADASQDKLSLESHAVQLSLLLARSCTESGPRQCSQDAATVADDASAGAPRQLRPVTISFGGPRGSARKFSTSTEAPLISSLKHFREMSA